MTTLRLHLPQPRQLHRQLRPPLRARQQPVQQLLLHQLQQQRQPLLLQRHHMTTRPLRVQQRVQLPHRLLHRPPRRLLLRQQHLQVRLPQQPPLLQQPHQ